MVEKKSCTQGFTLIELLVVVLIIGILAAVALPQYRYAVMRARYKQVVILGRAFQKAQKVYHLANGEYSRDWDALSIDFPPPIRQRLSNTGGHIVYDYDWGYCSFKNNVENAEDVNMLCHPTDAPTLGIRLDEDDTMYCLAEEDLSTENNKICRLDTGQTTPVLRGGYNRYYY